SLQARRETLPQRIRNLAERTAGGLRIRVHGDLHLGQVLVIQGDAVLIDFEGEPARSLEERRARHSPFKDVGGVLRSIDYAAAMAERHAQSNDTSSEANPACRQIVHPYRTPASAAFLQGYRQAAEASPHAWEDPSGAQAALWLFTLEKVLYEIAYEAQNRPAWLAVPLRGL